MRMNGVQAEKNALPLNTEHKEKGVCLILGGRFN